MTSLEHESADTSASASDYGPDNWDHENWGDMDTSQDPSSPMAGTSNPLTASLNIVSTANDTRDGWDNEDWGSLEEDPNEVLDEKEEDELVRNQQQQHHHQSSGVPSSTTTSASTSSGATVVPYLPPSSNNNANNNLPNHHHNSNSTASSSPVVTTTTPSGIPHSSPSKMLALKNMTNIMINNSNSNWSNSSAGDGWNDGDFEPIDEPSTGNSKLDEARRKREEKKQQRQRELEARRAARSAGGPGGAGAGGPGSSGPMKLGAKKIQLD